MNLSSTAKVTKHLGNPALTKSSNQLGIQDNATIVKTVNSELHFYSQTLQMFSTIHSTEYCHYNNYILQQLHFTTKFLLSVIELNFHCINYFNIQYIMNVDKYSYNYEIKLIQNTVYVRTSIIINIFIIH